MHDANVELEAPVPAPRSQDRVGERIAARTGVSRGVERRRGIWGELALALPPTLTTLIVMLLVDSLTHQRLLFASLAGSAFLIYYDPMHRMNSVRIMVFGQLIAATLGIGFGAIVGPGYVAAALSMSMAIVIFVVLDLVHPPAVATALTFAFVEPRALFMQVDPRGDSRSGGSSRWRRRW